MDLVCGDNRFELIEKYRKELIEATNIESSPDEMAVLNTILFRFWQMGWLDKLELPSAQLTQNNRVNSNNALDTISRQAAIDVAKEELDNGTFYDIPSKIESLPPAQPKPDEWCTDCKEYDTEKHCCPRFNRVIRNALKDAQPEIIRCEECRHYRTCEIFGKKITLCKRREYDALSVEPDDFCSRAERREK